MAAPTLVKVLGTGGLLLASKAMVLRSSGLEIELRLDRLTVAAMAALTLTGCATDHNVEGAPETRPSPQSSPFALYTHCGIDEANIDGRWYRASHQLSDGSGNPPKGWGNPFQQGMVTFTSDTEVVFTDTVGHQVLFVLRAGAYGPLRICS
jgi:hypothetical protein